jgi:hypothetical protein
LNVERGAKWVRKWGMRMVEVAKIRGVNRGARQKSRREGR